MSGSSGHLSLETLIAIIILLIYTISAPLFEKIHFHYMHESGMCMIIGVIITLIAMVLSPESNFTQTLQFNSEVFFTFILPPIIFAAGYNLRRQSFFKYFLYIMLFGVIGTIITFSVVAPLTYFANSNKLFWYSTKTNYQNNTITNSTLVNITIDEIDTSEGNLINFSIKEILLFSSVISATDTVAALTFVKEESEPKLFAILFGEGVINDAVCIVLYNIIKNFFASSKQEFTSKTPVKMMSSFVNLFFFSFIVGVLVGFACSLFLKKIKHLNINRTQECSIIIFFAFISYTLTEELGLSPIIALLFTGIVMSQYAFYNLSFQAREESAIVSRLMSNIAEAFVFTYLGLTLIYYMTHTLSISFIFWELIFVTFGRCCSIFGLSFIMSNIFKVHNFKIKTSEKGIMSAAGSIRGAIAFGLAISIATDNPQNKEVLISSTLLLVFFTTIVFGALMPIFIKFFKSLDNCELKEEEHHKIEEKSPLFDLIHPNFLEKEDNKVKENTSREFAQKHDKLSAWLSTYWIEFDHIYIKPKLIHNWPVVKEDNDAISHRILDAINTYQSESNNVSVENLDDTTIKKKPKKFIIDDMH